MLYNIFGLAFLEKELYSEELVREIVPPCTLFNK
jgi:hypothetical protein